MPNKHRWRIFTEPRGIWCKYTHTSTSSFVVINMRAACRNNVFMPCFSSHYLLNTLSRLELSSILFSLPFFFSLAGIYFCIILICFGYTRITRWPSALPIRSYISISFVRYATMIMIISVVLGLAINRGVVDRLGERHAHKRSNCVAHTMGLFMVKLIIVLIVAFACVANKLESMQADQPSTSRLCEFDDAAVAAHWLLAVEYNAMTV